MFERLIGGDDVEFLLGEFLAGGGDVLVVLADAGIEFCFTLIVESHAALGGVERVFVLVRTMAEFGEFAFEGAGGGAGFGDGFLFGGEHAFKLGVAHFQAAD